MGERTFTKGDLTRVVDTDAEVNALRWDGWLEQTAEPSAPKAPPAPETTVTPWGATQPIRLAKAAQKSDGGHVAE